MAPAMNLFEHEALVAKIDAATGAIERRRGDALACRAGCSSCCHAELSVCDVEAEALRRGIQGWWGGPGLGPRGQVRALAAWSGWPGELLAVLAVVALVIGAWFVVALARFVLQVEAEGPVGSMPT